MKRETINIEDELLYNILTEFEILEDDITEEEQIDMRTSCNYKLIENPIVGHDEYDGGASYEGIIQRRSDGKFFKIEYTDWDLDHSDTVGPYTKNVSLDTNLKEVFPEQITKTIYK